MASTSAARAATGTSGARGASGSRGALSSKAVNRAAPSKAAAPPGRKFERKDLPSWHDRQFQGKLDELKVLGDEITAMMAKRKAIDDEIKAHTAVAKAIMEEVSDKESWSVRDEAWTACYIKPEDRKTIVRELLVQQGVTLRQIEKATKKTPVKPYTTFIPEKSRQRGEEEE